LCKMSARCSYRKFNMSFNNASLIKELNVSLFAKIDYVNTLNRGHETTIS
jgi:hypothetical protein